MADILNRLDTFLGGNVGDSFGTTPIYSDDILNRMFEFVTDLDPDILSEKQAGILYEIIEDIDLRMEGIDEATPKKVRVKPGDKRENKLYYKKNRQKIKREASKYRKTSKGKQLAKKTKINNKRGKTATGKRMVSYK
jgi:hypothetical protein